MKRKEIKNKLDAGASFEELAKQESQDLLSKDKGGDLGYFNSGTMAPEFESYLQTKCWTN